MTAGPGARRKVELYDTTLRDGAQQTGLSYSIEDRMRILHKIDQLGVPFIEGGWPGANPRDTEFFKLATKETLRHAALTSFGMTRKAGERAEDSAVLRELLDTGTEVVCIVGKAWDLHVTEALRTDLDEGVAMVRDSIAFLRAQGRRVFFDAEHFFDGYRGRRRRSRCACSWRPRGGRRGAAGPLRHERRDAAARRCADRRRGERAGETALGIHVHNDAGCAVANSLIAVEHGAYQVQGVVNGYGERTGNADLIPIAANLVLKMGCRLPARRRGGAPHRAGALRRRGGERRPGLPPAVRGPVRLHAQGRAARERRRPARRGVRARRRPAAVGNRRGVVASDYGGGRDAADEG